MRIHLIAWGDSLTSGADWMGHLKYLGLAEATWEDHGWNGETSWQGVPRFVEWASTADPSVGDVVVLMWGTNDVRRSNWTVHKTLDALEQMRDAAKELGYPVVVAVPPPFTEGAHTAEEVAVFNERLEAIEAGLECRCDQLADVYEAWWELPGFPDLSYYQQQNDVADGVHPGIYPAISGHPGRYHLAQPIAEAIFLPEPEGGLFAGILVLAALAYRKRRRRR